MLETVLLATLTPLAYLAGVLLTARHYYQRWRPSRVPLCGKKEKGSHKHFRLPSSEISYKDRNQFDKTGGCYRQYGHNAFRGGYDTEGEAIGDALFAGLVWPVVALVLGLNAAIRAGAPESPAEKEARLRLLQESIGKLEKNRREAE